MSGRANYALTVAQREHLEQLHAFGAADIVTAATVFLKGHVGEQLNPNVVGILCEKGLANRKVVSRRGSRVTVYWLTKAGVAKTVELAEAGS